MKKDSLCVVCVDLSCVSETHRLHSMIVDELFCGDAVDLVHKSLLIREEVVEFVGQPSAEGDAAFVTLVQILHH